MHGGTKQQEGGKDGRPTQHLPLHPFTALIPCLALSGHATKEHWCYFRDVPGEAPVMVVHNAAKDKGVFSEAGDSLLAALCAECGAGASGAKAGVKRQKSKKTTAGRGGGRRRGEGGGRRRGVGGKHGSDQKEEGEEEEEEEEEEAEEAEIGTTAELRAALEEVAERFKVPLTKGRNQRRRKPRVNAQTFSKLGICVPFDKDTEIGYRFVCLFEGVCVCV